MSAGVLYLVGSFQTGGTESQLVEILRRLDRSRFRPCVVCLERRGGLLAEVERLGVPVHEMRLGSLLAPRAWRALDRAASWARAREVRIIQGFLFHGGLYGALLKRRCPGTRLVVCEQSIHGFDARKHHLGRLVYYRETDVITANCEAVRRAVVARDGIGAARVRVVYGGVDTDRFAPRPRPAGAGPGPVVGFVGRLHPDKGPLLLASAAPRILAGAPGSRIVFVGDGPLRGEIEAAVRGTGAGGRVELLGDRRDVPELLAGMDLLVLPSAAEGFANAALEGQASGLPVVASDAGGNPEIVADGETGRIFPAGDADRLAACVVEILRDAAAARRMGEAGRRRVERLFPLAEMVRRHERLYDELLGRPEAEAARAAPAEVRAP